MVEQARVRTNPDLTIVRRKPVRAPSSSVVLPFVYQAPTRRTYRTDSAYTDTIMAQHVAQLESYVAEHMMLRVEHDMLYRVQAYLMSSEIVRDHEECRELITKSAEPGGRDWA